MREPDPNKGAFRRGMLVIIKRTGQEIPLEDPLFSLAIAIGEDFMQPTRGGATDIVSAASEAYLTLEIVRRAGYKLVPDDKPTCENFQHKEMTCWEAMLTGRWESGMNACDPCARSIE